MPSAPRSRASISPSRSAIPSSTRSTARSWRAASCCSATRRSRASSTSPSAAASASSTITIRCRATAIPDYPELLLVTNIPEEDGKPSASQVHRPSVAFRHVVHAGAVARLAAARHHHPAGRRRHDVHQHVPGLRRAVGRHEEDDRAACTASIPARARSTIPTPIARRSRGRSIRRSPSRWCACIPRPAARRSISARRCRASSA